MTIHEIYDFNLRFTVVVENVLTLEKFFQENGINPPNEFLALKDIIVNAVGAPLIASNVENFETQFWRALENLRGVRLPQLLKLANGQIVLAESVPGIETIPITVTY